MDEITRLNDEQLNELIHEAEDASNSGSVVITNLIQMELLMRVIDQQLMLKGEIESINNRLDRLISKYQHTKTDDRFSSLDHEE